MEKCFTKLGSASYLLLSRNCRSLVTSTTLKTLRPRPMGKLFLRVCLIDTVLSVNLVLKFRREVSLSRCVLTCKKLTAFSQYRSVLSIDTLASLLPFMLVLRRLVRVHLDLTLINIDRLLLLHRCFPLVETRILYLNLLLVFSTASIAS